MADEFPIDDAAPDEIGDSQWESLLNDACAAPRAPHSLLRRIDRALEQEWQLSPRLSETRWSTMRSGLRRALAAPTLWRIVAPTVAVAAVIVLLSINSRSSAWASMLDAVEDQDIVEVRTADGMRWLSLSDGLVGERTERETRVLDSSRQVLLIRRHGDAKFQCRDLSTCFHGDRRELLMLAFMVGIDSLEHDMEWLDGPRLVEERLSDQSRDLSVIAVRFLTSRGRELRFQLECDPRSLLPRSTVFTTPQILPGSLTLSYPASEPEVAAYRDLSQEALAIDLESDVVPLDLDDEASATVAANVRDSDADGDASTATTVGPSAWTAVRPVALTPEEVLNSVDTLLTDLWSRESVDPAPLAEDAELMRRVYLDLTGRSPTVHEAREYLGDVSPDRYERLVDHLLASPDHASHLATVWRGFLIPDGVDLSAFGGVEGFDAWLAERFREGTPYNEIVSDLLLAEGRLSLSGPLLFYSAAKLDPELLASRVSRVFLGVRLECAQCHDHPFEPWTQEDFWSFAAFFSRISRPEAELRQASRLMQVRDVDHGEVMLPETETVAQPRFINSALPVADSADELSRREQLAKWLTSRENPYFARATVNRVWGQMFGIGIVHPIDDFGVQHSPRSPELLELLAGRLVHSNFDLRELFRIVALSRAYRLSSGTETADDRRLDCFAQMPMKMLTAEQMYDCITVATSPHDASGTAEFATLRIGNVERETFLQQFRAPTDDVTRYPGGIPQALTLMNGNLIRRATDNANSGLLKTLQAPFFTVEQRADILYLATLSRFPSPDEREVIGQYLESRDSESELQTGLADILWALLNSAEFTMNH